MRLRSKLTLSFASLLLLVFILQWYLFAVLKKSFFLSFFVGFVIVAAAVYVLAVLFTRPIRKITEMARQLTPEGFDQGIDLHTDDELERLSRTIETIGLELKEKVEEVSKEKDHLQTVLKGMMEGVLVVDGKGRILTVNDTLRDLLSLSSAVAHKTPLEIIRNSELEGAIRRVLETGKNSTLELNLPSSGGKTFEVNVVAMVSSPPESGKKPDGAIAVFHEITRLKELEKIRQDFVANVSHELRTPLTTIKGYVETLLEGALKEEVAYQFVQVISRHTDRLAKIVEDLLMLSKIESGEVQLKREPLPVADLIDDVLDFVKEAAEKKGVSVSRGDVSPSLFVEGDRNLLEQVFINLLDNAVKYNREGGRVTISVVEQGPRELRFSIRDDGIGIPKEDLSRIFERFYRVDKGRSKELGGTGLGLSIVKHIVQAHKGKVWAESEPGKGAAFHFTLPKPR